MDGTVCRMPWRGLKWLGEVSIESGLDEVVVNRSDCISLLRSWVKNLAVIER